MSAIVSCQLFEKKDLIKKFPADRRHQEYGLPKWYQARRHTGVAVQNERSHRIRITRALNDQ